MPDKSPVRYTLFSLALLGLGVSACADVVPSALFTDNAILQRDKPIPVWGMAEARERVVVTFSGQSVSTTADATGKWRVKLAALPANATPADLVIKGNNTITLTNVLVGEVWLASGQSNMELTVSRSYDAALDIPESVNVPMIRQIRIAKKTSDEPLATIAGKWEVAGPDTTGGFTAVGYFFAHDLHEMLHVPIGIINSSWGGTYIESWIDSDTINAPGFTDLRESWKQSIAAYSKAKTKFNADYAVWLGQQTEAKAANRPFVKIAPNPPSPWGQGAGGNTSLSGLYNGMIAPLVPYALRGAIWYQGENNTGHPSNYQALFSAMITGWRAHFGQGDFPFYWVQLANFNGGDNDGTNWAFLREAQTETLTLPNTGQAVTVDIGNVHDIHPRDKKDVGRRLARLALARTYGLKVVDSGPVMTKAERVGAGFRVTFKEAHGGLIYPLNTLDGFELAGADKVFHPAEAKIDDPAEVFRPSKTKIDGDIVFVTSAKVPEPVAVRYAWRNAPVAGLFNVEGLPAMPFRSDDW